MFLPQPSRAPGRRIRPGPPDQRLVRRGARSRPDPGPLLPPRQTGRRWATLEIRPGDGAIIARYDLPPDLPHVAGDLAIGPNGDVFVTDSRTPVVYRLAPGADSLTTFRHPLFRSLQGAAPTPDGRFVFLADYSHGLLRWDLAAGTVVRLSSPSGATSLGVDGILLDGNRIFGIQNGVAPARVVRFDLDRSGVRIRSIAVVDRHLPVADEPTIATILGQDLIYVANSQWEKYDDEGRRKPGTTLGPTVLLALKIRERLGSPSGPRGSRSPVPRLAPIPLAVPAPTARRPRSAPGKPSAQPAVPGDENQAHVRQPNLSREQSSARPGEPRRVR